MGMLNFIFLNSNSIRFIKHLAYITSSFFFRFLYCFIMFIWFLYSYFRSLSPSVWQFQWTINVLTWGWNKTLLTKEQSTVRKIKNWIMSYLKDSIFVWIFILTFIFFSFYLLAYFISFSGLGGAILSMHFYYHSQLALLLFL